MRLASGVATGDEAWQASTLRIGSVVELQLRYKLDTAKFALIEVLKFLFCRKKGVELELSDGKVERLSHITEIEVGIISQRSRWLLPAFPYSSQFPVSFSWFFAEASDRGTKT